MTPSEQPPHGKNKWSLTRDAFEKLLKAFSQDRDEAAVRHEILRRKLVRFFEWRGIGHADELTDETLNRVARRIEEGQIIDNLTSYAYGVARLRYMEAMKERENAPEPIDETLINTLCDKAEETVETDPDPRMLCLDRCLNSLPPENRNLIMTYYEEDKRAKIELRQELADSLHIPMNALRIRAHRIRVHLEKCIIMCLQTPATAK